MKPHDHDNDRVRALMAIAVIVTAFASGYATCAILHRGSSDDAHVRIMVEEAIRQGILVVDHDRIAALKETLQSSGSVTVPLDRAPSSGTDASQGHAQETDERFHCVRAINPLNDPPPPCERGFGFGEGFPGARRPTLWRSTPVNPASMGCSLPV